MTATSNTIPPAAIALIKEFEDCKLYAYPDPATGGEPYTIGWGATYYKDGLPVQFGDIIAQEAADELLEWHLLKFWVRLERDVPMWDDLITCQKAALLSFSYNTGWTYGADGFDTLNSYLKNGYFASVPDAFVLYRNPGTPAEVGLLRRRNAEGKLWKGQC